MTNLNIDSPLKELGILLGVFTETNGETNFNSAWFKNPILSFAGIGSKSTELLDLIRALFPDQSISGVHGSWNLLQTGTTPNVGYYIVIPPASGNTIGLGLRYTTFASGVITVASIYVPVLSLTTSGASVVLGDANSPLSIEFTVTKADGSFTSTKVAGEAINFNNIVFGLDVTTSGGTPTISSKFNVTDIVRTVVPATTPPTVLTNLSPTIFLSAIGNEILNRPEILAFLDSPLLGNCSIGNMFVGLGLMNLTGTTYTVCADIPTLLTKTPIEFIKDVFTRLLDQDVISIALGSGSVGMVKTSTSTGFKYGINFNFQDIALTRGDQGTQVMLQLGKWIANETGSSSWISRTDNSLIRRAGINLYFMEENTISSAFTFTPSFEANSIGIDVLPANTTPVQPLIDVGGFKLGSLETRFMFSSGTTAGTYGFTMLLGDMGIPLGPGFTQTSGTNPIAQNLLASSNPASAPTSNAVNPTFSVSMSYIKDPTGSHGPEVQLYDDLGNPSNQIWLPIQRSFGPLQCRSIGVNWDQTGKMLNILFEGSVAMPAFKVELLGLQIGIPVRDPTNTEKYSLDLNGLDLELKSGTTEIRAGLRKIVTSGNISYEGDALIKMGRFLVSAQAAYTTTASGQASLFIFAFLNTPLGGPPIFFVEGVAAGFGYNRDLILPEVDQIKQFPLIAGMGSASLSATTTPAEAVVAMSSWIPPKVGQYWLAAGLKFSSFKTIDTKAVFALKLGQSTQFSLTGISNFQMPKAPANKVYANIELGFQAVFSPDEGSFSVIAVLTDSSYLFTPNCRLSGGVAFKTWYKGDYKGQFVLTVGGYHPSFSKPAYYPDVPRLGFHWPVSNQINIGGEAYFALTPSCAMAGGWLSASYHDDVLGGTLSASFNVNTDIIIRWKPYNFLAGFGISISASYSHDVAWWTVTISAHIGASLLLWGPPTGGTFTVEYSIVSITINFGSPLAGIPNIVNWNDFKTSLPAPAEILKIQIDNGLINTRKNASNEDVWNVSGSTLEFNFETAFPIQQISYVGGTTPPAAITAAGGVNVRPMGANSVPSLISFTIEKDGVAQDMSNWLSTEAVSSLPEAIWGEKLPDPEMKWGVPVTSPQPTASANVVPNLLTGLSGIKPIEIMATAMGVVDLSKLPPHVIDADQTDYLPLSPLEEDYNTPEASYDSSIQIVADSIMNADVVDERNDIFAALEMFGVPATTNEALTEFSKNAESIFQINPMIGEIGAQQPEITPSIRILWLDGFPGGQSGSTTVSTGVI
ncbi:MAG: hypothetical protein ACI82Q_000589 [Nonlabens sp.]|jgi:hypothetical protein